MSGINLSWNPTQPHESWDYIYFWSLYAIENEAPKLQPFCQKGYVFKHKISKPKAPPPSQGYNKKQLMHDPS